MVFDEKILVRGPTKNAISMYMKAKNPKMYPTIDFAKPIETRCLARKDSTEKN